ncbi:MAG: L-threonylcarbamoyladenylate synthase [Desulfurococcales archaeon]|nr:L-threonylcarbamoyladenylate synthase [Desulfurococcales archaeon]
MAQIVSISEDTCLPAAVKKLANQILAKDGLLVYPTDTLYGLGTRITSTGLRNVFTVKLRPGNTKPPILISETHIALKLVEPSDLLWDLAVKYWPGPLTIVAKASENAPDPLKDWGYIGVRLPDSCIARELARLAGGYIIGTSANVSGSPTPSTVRKIYEIFRDTIELYIDAGPRFGPASTVVMIEDNTLKILRKGVLLP